MKDPRIKFVEEVGSFKLIERNTFGPGDHLYDIQFTDLSGNTHILLKDIPAGAEDITKDIKKVLSGFFKMIVND